MIFMERRKSRKIMVGSVAIGADAPITIQSMTNTDTRSALSTIAQIERLVDAGCEIIRVAVPDMAASDALPEIRRHCPIPLVADIHFNHILAIAAAKAGVDKIRINPGNIGSRDRVKEVVAVCRERGIPIRIGVNSGSVERGLLAKYPGNLPRAMAESAMKHIEILENENFFDICVSLKASDVPTTIAAYQAIAPMCPYPLHLGVTHAGTPAMGNIKAAAGIGGLLSMGIGDTIRVSLSADPVEEIKSGKAILQAVGLRHDFAEVISCPTCGRCQIDLIEIVNEVERAVSNIRKPIKIAVMGCGVNGPGEGKEADIGVACGRGDGLLFKKGKILYKVPRQEIVPSLMKLVNDELNGEYL